MHPAFLAKLWKMVDDPQTNDLIGWSDMGNSFIIKNQAKFSRDLLPLYYKHNNMASFVRQLNMYGFHKVVSVEQGGLRVDKDEMEFAHPFFLRGQESSLELIKRKIPASKHEESRLRPDSFNKVLLDVRQMKGRQESMDNKLITMKRENEALWRELASLRQKHAKQTQIVSKLLQFLVGMMSQQTPRLAFKRNHLMLNDKDGVKQKLARTDTITGPVIHDVTELLESDDSAEDAGDQVVDVSGVLTSDLINPNPATVNVAELKAEPFLNQNQTTNTIINQPQLIQASGISTAAAQNTVPTTLYFTAPGMSEPVQVVLSIPDQQTSTATTNTVETASTPLITQTANISNVVSSPNTNNTLTSTVSKVGIGRDELGGHLNDVEMELNSLRDIFKNEDYRLDNNSLSGVSTSRRPIYTFAAIDPEKLFDGSPLMENAENQIDAATQNQLVAPAGIEGNGSLQGAVTSYTPSLFELAEENSNLFDESSNIFLDDELESMLTTDRDSLKRPEVPQRNLGQLTFSGLNFNNLGDAGLQTPGTEQLIQSAPSTSVVGGKRKRKQ